MGRKIGGEGCDYKRVQRGVLVVMELLCVCCGHGYRNLSLCVFNVHHTKCTHIHTHTHTNEYWRNPCKISELYTCQYSSRNIVLQCCKIYLRKKLGKVYMGSLYSSLKLHGNLQSFLHCSAQLICLSFFPNTTSF